MENPCKIVCFGDSITKAWTRQFNARITSEYPNVEVINEGAEGDTTYQGLERVEHVLGLMPDVATLGFGMNDVHQGIRRKAFARNMGALIDAFLREKIRIVVLTMNPDDMNGQVSERLVQYNQDLRDIAYEKRVRIADVYSLWLREFARASEGLQDPVHPNEQGNDVIVKALMRTVPRRTTTVVWQFNGEHAFCNYACPYCYVSSSTNVDHRYSGTPELWHDAFRKSFGQQKLLFYLTFGEPMASKGFYDVLSMITAEPHWEGHMTSNLSFPLDKLLKTELVREGRFHVNASFHPTQTTIGKFLEKLLILRDHGIECPVIYVMYPPQIDQFESLWKEFDRHQFLVHVRRFRGRYGLRRYPQAYTEAERQFIARYCDDATIKYMLNEHEMDSVGFKGKLTYAGMYYILVTCEGDVFLTPDHKGKCLGNVMKNNVRLHTEPEPYGGSMDGTIDGIASLLETDYKELEGNHVMSFAAQGGVRKENGRVTYMNLEADFSDREIRKCYGFPDGLARVKLWLNSFRP